MTEHKYCIICGKYLRPDATMELRTKYCNRCWYLLSRHLRKTKGTAKDDLDYIDLML